MKWLYKLALWLVGLLVPVVLAACYGVPYQYTRRGEVGPRQDGCDRLPEILCVETPQGYRCFDEASGEPVPLPEEVRRSLDVRR